MSGVDQRDLQTIYRARFCGKEAYRRKVWSVLVRHFFQRYIRTTDRVLDLGYGYGEFIRSVEAKEKFAMDLNPDGMQFLPSDVRVLTQDCSMRWALADASLDVVFTSNFFEHLTNKVVLGSVFDEIARCLKQGGILIAMGPNIARVRGAYWDFWDHHVPLTEKSLAEALRCRGFEIDRQVPAFLPYTMEGKRQYPVWMLAWYLHLPFCWRFFGGQFLVIARKK